jgi:hypothetical protein
MDDGCQCPVVPRHGCPHVNVISGRGLTWILEHRIIVASPKAPRQLLYGDLVRASLMEAGPPVCTPVS